ncbi:Longin-like domain-containing protein [Gorgonomyces haynaldii]|nr:Longin-like domain-containing protein [Gorgonomyces haynaldii]
MGNFLHLMILSCAVTTKQGKTLVSRQFVEMSRSRIEGLLSTFPKLVSNDQHTFVETDQVRFVYQPLEQLYVVLVTTKQSNILQDIDSLHLFSRTIGEYCPKIDEKQVISKAFELLGVFDEIVSLGYRESVNLGQLRTIAQMESHDERIQAEIEKNKEKEAKEEIKRKAKQLDMQKREQKRGSTQYPSHASAAVPGKGMQLGNKNRQNSLFETIKQEEGLREQEHVPVQASKPLSPVLPTVDEKAVHVLVEEKVSANINREGGLHSLEVNGTVLLKVNDPSCARLRLGLEQGTGNTHPNVDKQQWASQSMIALRDPSRPFPVNQPLGVLKWRMATTDESHSANPPTVADAQGDYEIDKQHRTIHWKLDVIDPSSSTGVLEFQVDQSNVDAFFPINVQFFSQKTVSGVKVLGLNLIEGGSPDYSTQSRLVTDSYQIS